MINKIVDTVTEALADVRDGVTIMIGGFGSAGQPLVLINGLLAQGARELTIVCNNAGNADQALQGLTSRYHASVQYDNLWRHWQRRDA